MCMCMRGESKIKFKIVFVKIVHLIQMFNSLKARMDHIVKLVWC
ncbi:hypothetical protein EDE11_108150 [Methylomonas methanica]|uniref:Uncharacterized protein n=1 Tax=Methylomonas methanica TaxID=421 RepID=A0ABY2CMD7_METMH|nr:hypothetical protein EDE11_108150 [Methylomonas methanica]